LVIPQKSFVLGKNSGYLAYIKKSLKLCIVGEMIGIRKGVAGRGIALSEWSGRERESIVNHGEKFFG
jgi:hypothetical protein